MAEIPHTSNNSDDGSESPLEMVSQPTVEEVDRNFIRKTIEYVQTLPGANKDRIKVQTNTTFPSRYVLMLCNLPAISIADFDSIKTLAPHLRDISISLKDDWLKIDVWKQGARPTDSNQRKKRKYEDGISTREWNLATIGSQDQKMLTRILDDISNLPTFPCQFHVDVKNEPPDHYFIDIISNDIIQLSQLEEFKNTFRAFVKNIVFNFSSNSLRLEIERASASVDNVSKRRLVTYKRNIPLKKC